MSYEGELFGQRISDEKLRWVPEEFESLFSAPPAVPVLEIQEHTLGTRGVISGW